MMKELLEWRIKYGSWQAAAGGLLFLVLAGLLHSGGRGVFASSRADRMAIAEAIHAQPAAVPVACWRANPEFFVYYGKRHLQALNSLEKVEQALADSVGGKLLLLLPAAAVKELPVQWGREVLGSSAADQEEDSQALLLLDRNSQSAR